MSTVRWSLRLPRALSLKKAGVLQGRVQRRVPIAHIEQRRWLRNRPPPPKPRSTRPKPRNDAKDGLEVSSQTSDQQSEQPGRNSQLAETLAQSDTSDLVTKVRIPDDPDGVLPSGHPARSLLGNSSLVIQRQIEMMNLLVGFEQANRYIIMDGQGQTIGYIAEQDHGIGRAFVRQFATTHRSFTTYVFDKYEREVLRIHRPFAFINSRIRIYDPVPEEGYGEMETSTALQGTSTSSVVNQGSVSQVSPLKLDEMRIIGEAQQQWAPLRRKYNLFSYRPIEPSREDSTPRIESGEKAASETMALTESKANDTAIEAGMLQFAHVNEPFLSWDFTLKDEEQKTVGSVNRDFAGFGRELFTDTGVYALRMDSAAQSSTLESAGGEQIAQYEREATAMTLDQRAVMLATAVSIDFDYFSRHSHAGGGGFMPIFWPMGGGAAAEGGAAGAGAGAAGAEAGVVGAAEGAGAIGGAAGRGLGGAAGAGEGAIAGAGTMAGYEAMQRGVYGPRGGDDTSPTNNEPFASDASPNQNENQTGNDVWGEGEDPWGRGGPGDGPPPPSAGGEGGSGEGGGWMDAISDFFGD